MRDEGYSSCPVCLCMSIFSILPSCTFGHPMRGISSHSAENAVKLQSHFYLKVLSSKVRSVINLLRLSQPFSRAMFPYLIFRRTETIQCMHYGITLWAYLSEPLVRHSHLVYAPEKVCSQCNAVMLLFTRQWSIPVNTQLQSHALLCWGFGTSVPFMLLFFVSVLLSLSFSSLLCVWTAVHLV